VPHYLTHCGVGGGLEGTALLPMSGQVCHVACTGALHRAQGLRWARRLQGNRHAQHGRFLTVCSHSRGSHNKSAAHPTVCQRASRLLPCVVFAVAAAAGAGALPAHVALHIRGVATCCLCHCLAPAVLSVLREHGLPAAFHVIQQNLNRTQPTAKLCSILLYALLPAVAAAAGAGALPALP
jgi:hypothetical protein